MVQIRGYTEDDVDVLADEFALVIQGSLQRAVAAAANNLRGLTAAGRPHVFHLPGKHNQKDHGRGYRNGSDLTGDSHQLADKVIHTRGHYPEAESFGKKSEDSIMLGIAQEQGFDGLPGVVSSHEMDGLIADGGPELYRGVSGTSSKPGAKMQQEMREGPAYFGSGMYGNGVYVGTQTHAMGFADKAPGSVVRVTLRPEARVGSYDSIYREWSAYHQNLDVQEYQNPSLGRTATTVFSDPGRFAMAQGWDAYTTPEGSTVVLNRSALIMEES